MALRIACMLVRLASVRVPRRVRAEWLEEWHAELAHAAEAAEGTAADLIVAALGSFHDAGAVRAYGGGADQADRVVWRGSSGDWIRQLALATRSLRRAPAISLIAVVTLALGMGAVSVLYTVVDAVLVQPLPYRAAERLVRVQHPVPGLAAEAVWPLSMHGFFHLAEARSLVSLGVYVAGSANLAGGPAERIRTAAVSASLFEVFDAVPHLGRFIRAEENRPGSPLVIVLGHAFWQRRFGADTSVVGRRIRVNGAEREVIGVAPALLELPERQVDIWIPLWLDRDSRPVNSHYLSSVGRLRADATFEQARAELRSIAQRFPDTMPTAYSAEFADRYGFSTEVIPLRNAVVGDAGRTIWVVFGAVGIVLLVACANVANLVLVRAEGRHHEVAVRVALGARRRDLARMFLAESLVVTFAAAFFALLLTWVGVPTLVAIAPAGFPRLAGVSVRGGTLLFVTAVGVITTVAFALVPLLRYARAPHDGLGAGTARLTAGRTRHRVRAVLVIGQVAAALVLLAAAGLLVRTVQALRAVHPGFETPGVLTAQVTLPPSGYDTPDAWNRFYQRLLDDVRALPGVEAAGAILDLPLVDTPGCYALFVQDQPVPAGLAQPCVSTTFVTPGYFEAMGIPIEGREYEAADNLNRTGVVVVSRALAEQYWPGQSALGRGIKLFHEQPPHFRIAGIAGDVHVRGLAAAVEPIAYFPLVPIAPNDAWAPPSRMTLVLRTRLVQPEALTPAIRDLLRAIDPEIPLANPRMLEDVVARSLQRVTFLLVLLGIAAALALALGTVGLYGVISHVVGLRRREIGIRMALGAPAALIRAHVVMGALGLVAAGIAFGLLGAFFLTRVLASLLFGVRPIDPIALSAAALLMLIVALLASAGPAVRAARVDPARTLRSEG
jgi:predicted permease